MMLGELTNSKTAIGNLSLSGDMARLAVKHLEWLALKNYSPLTVSSRCYELGDFIRWCHDRSLDTPQAVTPAIINRYRSYLFHYRKADQMLLSMKSQLNRLIGIRVFFRWLCKQQYLVYNPAAEIELPKLGDPLPKSILNQEEAEKIIFQVNIHNPLGLRDRAILELFYSTGIRRAEMCQLKLEDVDLESNTLIVRQGKGNKDRMVPIGERAGIWLDKYLHELRPELCRQQDAGTVFVSARGKAFKVKFLGWLVRKYINQAGITKKGSCHMFRHAMATLMLEGGADTRFIQQMLGHAKLETTQIYTRVSIRKLQDVHARTHPGARMKGQKESD